MDARAVAGLDEPGGVRSIQETDFSGHENLPAPGEANSPRIRSTRRSLSKWAPCVSRGAIRGRNFYQEERNEKCTPSIAGNACVACPSRRGVRGIVEVAPFLHDRVAELRDWSDLKILTVRADPLGGQASPYGLDLTELRRGSGPGCRSRPLAPLGRPGSQPPTRHQGQHHRQRRKGHAAGLEVSSIHVVAVRTGSSGTLVLLHQICGSATCRLTATTGRSVLTPQEGHGTLTRGQNIQKYKPHIKGDKQT
jgi:hypothetical protein